MWFALFSCPKTRFRWVNTTNDVIRKVLNYAGNLRSASFSAICSQLNVELPTFKILVFISGQDCKLPSQSFFSHYKSRYDFRALHMFIYFVIWLTDTVQSGLGVDSFEQNRFTVIKATSSSPHIAIKLGSLFQMIFSTETSIS